MATFFFFGELWVVVHFFFNSIMYDALNLCTVRSWTLLCKTFEKCLAALVSPLWIEKRAILTFICGDICQYCPRLLFLQVGLELIISASTSWLTLSGRFLGVSEMVGSGNPGLGPAYFNQRYMLTGNKKWIWITTLYWWFDTSSLVFIVVKHYHM